MRDLKAWLRDVVFPLWAEKGVDRVGGGFYEQLDANAEPLPVDRRFRVASRQTYAFIVAGQLGWDGPWRETAAAGFRALLSRYRRPDGLFRRTVHDDGTISDDTTLFYDQATVLFLLANARAEFEDEFGVTGIAREIIAELERTRRTGAGGFIETDAHPWQSNAHMHFLEAMIAWRAIDDDPKWARLADETGSLALDRFINPRTGLLHEFFSEGWAPAPGIDGHHVEPGHQFEWAFLLNAWGGSRAQAAVQKLFANGVKQIDTARNLAPFACLDDGNVREPVARFWAQAEWLRTALVFGDAAQEKLAMAAVDRYLDRPKPGLWLDRIDASNQPVEEPVTASTLYHIIGAALAQKP
jgi:mannose-1-phosphate guanylyltransferase/mannose-6-phosphate isomerase